MTSFKYLGRVLMVGDDDSWSVAGKMRTARKIWVRMMRILSREGAVLLQVELLPRGTKRKPVISHY